MKEGKNADESLMFKKERRKEKKKKKTKKQRTVSICLRDGISTQ